MLKHHLVPKVVLSGLLTLSVSMPALATHTITSDKILLNSQSYGNNASNGIQTIRKDFYHVKVDDPLNIGNNTGTVNLNTTNAMVVSGCGTFIKDNGIKVIDAPRTVVPDHKTFDLAGERVGMGLHIHELYYQNAGTADKPWHNLGAPQISGGNLELGGFPPKKEDGNLELGGFPPKKEDGNSELGGFPPKEDGGHSEFDEFPPTEDDNNNTAIVSVSNTSTPIETDTANTVASMPVVALSVIKTINTELRNRLGELRSNNPQSKNGFWARGYYKSLEVDENIKNEMDIYGVEVGYDHLISNTRTNRTYLGIMAGYAWADKVKVHQTNGYKGKGDTTVPSVGAYLTWINKNGWYTDTVIRGYYTQMDVTNYSAQGSPITYDADNWAVAGSFEFGRRMGLYQQGRSGFAIEPKAQVVYTYMPSATHKTNLGQKIKYDMTQSLVTRAAIMAAYRCVMRSGVVLEPYIQVGVAYEWFGETDVNFAGSDFTSDVSGVTFEGVLGLSARLSRGWHAYGDLTIEQGSVYKSWGGHLGLRYNF